ncbi:MAG: ABC transporter permease subunit [Actinomycetia bacterium]|nr:ABC transporter permease subunit [Actinomycetes bacterium]
MLRNVFLKAVRDRTRTILWWMLGSSALIAWVSFTYPIMRDSEAMLQFIEDFPPEMLAIFGIDPATYLTGAGFLQAQFYSMFGPLMVIGLAISIAVGATASEEKNGTMDVLLSAPISRTSVMAQKGGVVALLVGLVVVSLTIMLLTFNAALDMGLGIENLLAANISLWLLGLVFGAITLVAGAFSGRPSTAIGVGTLAAIVAWFVNAFVALYTWLEIPSKLSPFTWYLEGPPLLNGWSSGQVWLIVAAIVFAVVAIVLFGRRDIATESSVVPESRARRKKTRTISPRATGLLGDVLGKSVWDRRRSVWAWAIGLASLMLLTFAAWPAFSKDSATVADMVDAMPKEMFALFGMTDPDSLSTAAGFISSRTYQSVGPIVMLIFSVSAVSSLVAKEESRGVLDMVLSNPLTRRNVLLAKATAIALLSLFIGFLLTIFGLIGNAIWDTDLEVVNVLAANTGLALLALCFGGIALGVWSLLGSGPAIGITAAIGAAAWFLNGLGSVVDGLAPFRILSPFYWYLGDKAPLAKGFEPQYLLLLAVAVIGTAVAVWRFESRDLAV